MIECTCNQLHGLSGGIKLSTDPEYIALKAKVMALPSLAERLNALGVSSGFYGEATPDLIRRRALTRNLLAELLEDVDTGWFNALDASGWTVGDTAAAVIGAALDGVVDAQIFAVTGGTTIQELIETAMTVPEAVDVLAAIDPQAALVVAQGATVAGGQHTTEYGAMLSEHFTQRFTDFANPFTNPITGTIFTVAAVAGLALLAYKITQRRK